MDINFIKSQDSWKNVSTSLNENFATIKSTVEEITEITTSNKGLYSTLTALKAAWGSPNEGDYALVGTSAPFTVYYVNNGAWTAGGTYSESISLNGVPISEEITDLSSLFK